MSSGRHLAGVVALSLFVVACGRAAPDSSPPPETPRPAISLRGGVRGELGEAEKSERERREAEQKLLENLPTTPAP